MFKGHRGPVEEFASRWGPSADLWFVGVDSGRGMDSEHVASLEVGESTIDEAYKSSHYLSPVACLRNKALVFYSSAEEEDSEEDEEISWASLSIPLKTPSRVLLSTAISPQSHSSQLRRRRTLRSSPPSAKDFVYLARTRVVFYSSEFKEPDSLLIEAFSDVLDMRKVRLSVKEVRLCLD